MRRPPGRPASAGVPATRPSPRHRPPGFAECFGFPVATPRARRDLFIGGTLLLLTLPGWILNLGHRLRVVHLVWRGEPPYFRGFRPWGETFRYGLLAFTAIVIYLAPSLVLAALAWLGRPGVAAWIAAVAAALLFGAGVFALPGGMTRNAVARDLTYLARPDRALRAALAGGRGYLKAWLIAASAIALSFLGLVAAGIGFLYTSVWAWSVVGYAFTSALQDRPAGPGGPNSCEPSRICSSDRSSALTYLAIRYRRSTGQSTSRAGPRCSESSMLVPIPSVARQPRSARYSR